MGAAASSIAPAGSTISDTQLPMEGPLSPFPPEVIDVILEHLEWREVLALLRVNSLFYGAIAWRIVNRVRVFERDDVLQVEAQHTERRLFLSTPVVSRWLPLFVAQLDVYPHDVRVVEHSTCADMVACERHSSPRLRELLGPVGRLELPNLRTLRLFFNAGPLHTDMAPNEPSPFPCGVLPSRRPENITFRGVPARALKYFHSHLPPRYCDVLVRQVHVIGPELVGEHGTVNGTIYLNWWDGGRALDTLESAEVVFWTPAGGEWLPIPPSREQEWAHGSLQRWFDRMLRTLQMSFIELSETPPPMDWGLDTAQPRKQCKPRLTIVNAGAISSACYARPTDVTTPDKWASYGAREEAVAAAFEALWRTTLPPILRGKRAQLAQRVRFVSLDEWVQEGKWRDVFDPAEVGLEG